MTVHNAKGLEFPVVFMTGMEENTFPHKFSIDTDHGIEEERRLCYVGITRAMDRIYITSAELRRSYIGPENKLPSRFINEIPWEFINRKEYISQGFGWSGGGSRENYSQVETKLNMSDRMDVPDRAVIKESYINQLNEKKEDSDESGSKFNIKESVMHPKFGVGRIVGIEGTGDNIKLTISFGLTRKVFMEKYTPLQKLN